MEEKEQQTVQPMAQFFADRVEEYDAHMLEQVEGGREAYKKVAACIPQDGCWIWAAERAWSWRKSFKSCRG